MVQATAAVASASADTSDLKTKFLAAYRWMLLARLVEEKLAALYRGGKITGGVFLGKGQEALSAATGMALRKGDVFAPLIRDQAGRMAFGESILDCTRTYMGSRQGPMRGRDGNVHRGRPREGLMAMISHLGAMLPVVAGTLLARRFRGIEGTVGVACLGDGATSTGAFHEGINLAAVEKLPMVLVIANNQYAYSTPTSRQFVCEDLVDKAIGYGIAGHSVDGTDLEACLKVLERAVTAARTGGGPQFIVASLLRLVGHGEHDDASYVDPKLRESALGSDCLKLAEQRIIGEDWATPGSLRDLQDDLQRQVEDAVATTMREALPDPNTEDWCALATRHLSEGDENSG
jgi:pyruvate dehydrogenase E1 component alpha subunit/2-oxoisovalerate dehydrogenase E1 component alpha subunit